MAGSGGGVYDPGGDGDVDLSHLGADGGVSYSYRFRDTLGTDDEGKK